MSESKYGSKNGPIESIETEQVPDQVAAVRAFNRFWTAKIGVLRSGLLETPFTLTEARVLFEIAHRPLTDISGVRQQLDIDAGYLSRVVGQLEAKGMVATQRAAHDARRKLLSLTPVGEAAFSDLDERSRAEIEGLLSVLSSEQRQSAVSAMEALRALFSEFAEPTVPEIREAGPGDYGWIAYRHGVLRSRQHSWDERYEGSVALQLANFIDQRDFRREMAWIAELDGSPAGAVLCTKEDEDTAAMNLFFVEPIALGRGVDTALLNTVLAFVRQSGYLRVKVTIQDSENQERELLEASGFQMTQRRTHTQFGPRLGEETWEMEVGSNEAIESTKPGPATLRGSL